MNKYLFIPALTALCFILCPAISYSQAGALDPTFGDDGIVITSIGSNYDNINAIAIQSDGKIVAGGFYAGATDDYVLARYNDDGSLDNSFGIGGIVTTDFYSTIERITSVGIQDDGKIVAAGFTYFVGEYYFSVARYSSDGSLDFSFDDDGKVMTSVGTYGSVAADLAIQPDGKIVVVGVATDSISLQNVFGVVRYNSDGSLDNSFDSDGIVTVTNTNQDHPKAVALQVDGKIVIAGNSSTFTTSNFTLVRLNMDGTLDNSFNLDGIVSTDVTETDVFNALAIQADGKIIAGGHADIVPTDNDFIIIRYHPDGTMDESFGIDGIKTTEINTTASGIRSIVVQPDGKIIAGGYFGIYPDIHFALARYKIDGEIDSTYGTNGVITTIIGIFSGIYEIAIQTDGKIVAGGYSDDGSGYTDFTVTRYLSDGATNISSSNFGDVMLIYPNPTQDEFTLETPLELQGKTLIVFDSKGNLLKRILVTGEKTQISLAEFSDGIYSLIIIDKINYYTNRIIIQH